ISPPPPYPLSLHDALPIFPRPAMFTIWKTTWRRELAGYRMKKPGNGWSSLSPDCRAGQSTKMTQLLRLAMWSGPRNISTAMMRSWGNRPDTVVVDEPFYAFYLKETGTKHPGAEEVIARGEADWRKVVEQCSRNANPVEDSPGRARTLSAPTGKKIFYQKQMTHHLLPEISRDW